MWIMNVLENLKEVWSRIVTTAIFIFSIMYTMFFISYKVMWDGEKDYGIVIIKGMDVEASGADFSDE